ncbi:DUF6544 family protein [Algoriphagus sp. SE2]|uniref:DUF6544 family protein n=1 Tax=Algoriphagus sp. SE2 TaxID=3141536 RepID=UPI0031CD423F
MSIALSVFGLILIFFLLRRMQASFKFKKEVQTLFSESKSNWKKKFYKDQLDKLPEPVQRYFNYVLKEGQPYINYARIKHVGQFKPGIDKDWINVKGEQYASTQRPGFIWKGTTSLFVAKDMYISDKGRLLVSILSLFNIVNASGEHYDQGELLRWLGESVMYPTNLLPSERLKWTPIDSNSAKLNFGYKQHSLFFKITFNEIGEITEMETKRYMDEKNLETWLIKTTDYKLFENVLIPTGFDVIWRLEKGDYSYAKFIITEAEFNNPKKF